MVVPSAKVVSRYGIACSSDSNMPNICNYLPHSLHVQYSKVCGGDPSLIICQRDRRYQFLKVSENIGLSPIGEVYDITLVNQIIPLSIVARY